MGLNLFSTVIRYFLVDETSLHTQLHESSSKMWLEASIHEEWGQQKYQTLISHHLDNMRTLFRSCDISSSLSFAEFPLLSAFPDVSLLTIISISSLSSRSSSLKSEWNKSVTIKSHLLDQVSFQLLDKVFFNECSLKNLTGALLWCILIFAV